MSVKAFFKYANAREQIRLDRAAGWPREEWTNDPIFLQYRFCNVFREDDKTTKWFAENVRAPLSLSLKYEEVAGDGKAIVQSCGDLLFATIAFRWFNRIEVGKVIKSDLLSGVKLWNPESILSKLKDVKPVTTGAYMIKTPAKMKKVEGILWILEQIRPQVEYVGYLIKNNNLTLEQAWTKIQEWPFMGEFYAYEVVTDLRYTALLCNASDIMTWANPGPGAARGFARVVGKPLDEFDRHNQKDRAALIKGMHTLLKHSKKYWRWSNRPWEMREVEHTLCEFDKYERVRLGEGRPKERFKCPMC